MTVEIVSLQRNSGAPVALNFRDEFNSPAGVYLGPAWSCITTPLNGISGAEVDASLNVAGGNATFGSGTLTNDQAGKVLCIPNQVYWPRIRQISTTNGRGQFAEVQLNSVSAGTAGSVLVSCALSPDGNITHGYTLNIDQATTQVDCNGHGVVLQSNVMTYALNDIIRLEYIFSPSAITLRCLQNGILRATVVDNGGGRITDGGYYGLIWPGAQQAIIGLNYFSGGVI